VQQAQPRAEYTVREAEGRAEERGSMADDQSFGGRALQISIIPWLSYPVVRTARWGCGMCKPEQPFDGAECWDS
jgi:hypothetical protein